MTSLRLPRTDELMLRPELASLTGLINQIEIVRRALRASYPTAFDDSIAPGSWTERRAKGIEMRAMNLAFDIEDFIRDEDPDPR